MRGALIRRITRWVLLLLAVAFAAYDGPQTWHNYSKWRLALPSDSVAAGFWRTAFYSDVREIVVILAIAIAAWFALRPRTKREGAAVSRQSNE
jgi:hypothetical protein